MCIFTWSTKLMKCTGLHQVDRVCSFTSLSVQSYLFEVHDTVCSATFQSWSNILFYLVKVDTLCSFTYFTCIWSAGCAVLHTQMPEADKVCSFTFLSWWSILFHLHKVDIVMTACSFTCLRFMTPCAVLPLQVYKMLHFVCQTLKGWNSVQFQYL